MHESSKAALQRRVPGTAVFMCFSGAMLRGTLGIYLSGSVSPAHTNPVPAQGTAVSPLLLSPHESLVFPGCRNLQPHHSPLAPPQAQSPGPSLPALNVKCKKGTQESLLNTSSYESIKIYVRYIYLIYLSLPVKADGINTENQIRLLISMLKLCNSIVQQSFCEFLNIIDPFPIKLLFKRLSFYQFLMAFLIVSSI